MGSIKELLFDIQEEWRHEWISINYPEAEEETLEWDAAAQEYSWFRDWMEEAAEQQHFEASLNCIPERLQEALDELHELQGLLETEQLIVSPNLLSELKNLSIQEGYMLKIENVLPPNFRVFWSAKVSFSRANHGCVVPGTGCLKVKYSKTESTHCLFN